VYIRPMSATPDTAELDPGALPARAGWANDTSLFASRVAVIFATKIGVFLMGGATLFLVAALLDPGPAGEYSLLQTWIGMLFAFGQLGMPSAMTFMAGRGGSVAALQRIAIGLTIALSLALSAVVWAALPFLQDTVLRALGGGSTTASSDLLKLLLAAVPMMLISQFGAGVLYTHGLNRAYNRIQLLVAASMLILTGILIGFVPFGVGGAVTAYLVANALGAVAVLYEVNKLARRSRNEADGEVSLTAFASYGLKLYPQSITTFFSYRADVLLLSWLLGDPKLIIYYGVAVKIAEMTFYVPDSIAAMLYPAISASTKAEADRLATSVSRLAMLLTFLVAVAIIPAGCVAIWVLLRHEYHAAIPALLVIMPGILSLSLSKVLACYVSGLGRPVATTAAGMVGLSVNLVVNLILIPRWGIVGASAASLISYSCHAAILLAISSRWAHVSPLAFILPRRAEFTRVWGTARGVLAMIRAMVGRRGRPAGGTALGG
jgi:O-antigen/teichoic acid export membrane protein